MEERQQALEQQLRDQDARIRELERLLREALATRSPAGAASEAPATQVAEAPAPQAPAAAAAAGSAPEVPGAASARLPGSGAPEYIGNLGVKLYDGERAQ